MNGQLFGTLMRQRRANPLLIVLVAVPVVVVAAAVVAVVKVAGGGEGAPASAATHPAGATVRDSWFAFRVADVRTRKGVKGIAGDMTAKGTFVLVSLDVTDRDDKPWTIFSEDQKLRAAGRTYAVNARATVDADTSPQASLQRNLNPGEKQRIVVVYDVPPGAVPQAIELHGAPKSRGVTVALPAAAA